MSIVFWIHVVDLIVKFSNSTLGIAGCGAALAYDELVVDERDIVGAELHPMLPELTLG